SPDGRFLAVGGDIGLVLPFQLAKANYNSEFHPGERFGAQEPVYDIAYAPLWKERPVLATASLGLRLWDHEDDDYDVDISGTREVFVAIAWSPDCRAIAGSNLEAKTVSLWKLDQRLRPISSQTVEVLPWPSPSLAFSPDGRSLAVAFSHFVGLFDV